ncbi:MAG: hypothetical protein ACOYXY_08545 [Thermodesulfobacteriota bacterium]
MNREELERTVIEYMDSFTTMTLASCMEERPWAAAVFYARQGWDLIFFSSPASLHSSMFAANPRAAAAIHGDYKGWKEIKGLQMDGTVIRISGARAKAKATTTYLSRYPFVKELLSDPGSISSLLAKKVAKVALYMFRPTTIRYLNNESGFGTRWQLQIRNGRVIGDAMPG